MECTTEETCKTQSHVYILYDYIEYNSKKSHALGARFLKHAVVAMENYIQGMGFPVLFIVQKN